jgi:peptide/nickel transport system substrate-binding protein
VLALTALLLIGCGGGGATNGGASTTLVVGRAEAIDGMSGDSCLGTASVQTMPMIYGRLLTNTEDGFDVTGSLAKSYEYDAKARTYTLHLEQDAEFSNGDPLTADDVVFSVDQWTSGTTSGAYYEMIDRAEAVDEHTAVIHLKHPDTFLPALLTWCTSTVYPKDFAGLSAKEYFKKPISAGPYSVAEWRNPGRSEVLVLERNEGWFNAADGEPAVERIEIRSSADMGQQVLAFEAGDVDVVEQITSDEAAQLDPGLVQQSKPSYVQDLMINNAGALADADVRRAISLAINRDQLAEVVGGGAVPAEGVLPINVPNSVLGDVPESFDLDAAQALMAGKPDVKVKLVFEGQTSAVRNAANLIREDLATIGITVELDPADSATIFSKASSGDFDMAISGIAAISPTAFDPASFLLAAWYPWTGSDSAVLQEEYLRGTRTEKDDERDDAIRNIQNDANDQATVIGLWHDPASYAVSSRVGGFRPLQYRYWDSALVDLNGEG